MKKYLSIIIITISLIIPNRGLFAQYSTDTLEMAKQLRSGKKFKKAFALLKEYQKDHPDDINTMWLYANTAYLMKKFKTSEKEYEKAIKLDPKNAYLILDYNLMLVNSGKLEKAKPLLHAYFSWDTTNVEVLTSLAKISLWQGDFNDAYWYINKALTFNPEHKEAIAIRDEIIAARSPWGKINIGYVNDDQPLKIPTIDLAGGVYRNALFSTHFNFKAPTFVTDSTTTNAWLLQLGNKSIFGKQKMELDVGLGLLEYPVTNDIKITGNILLSKIFMNYFVISAQAERKSYLYAVSSLYNEVMDNHFSISALWTDPDKWTIKTSFDLDHFNDKNTISTVSGWCLSPPVKVSIFKFRIGYGFNSSTSKENHFVAIKTISEIIGNFYYNPEIKGIFNPYYTPNKQHIQSVIASGTIHPLKTLDFGVKVSYGFIAITQNPYLYLDNDADGNIYIAKDFYERRYSPMDFNVNALWRPTKMITFKADYIFSRTNYYKNNYLAVGINMIFWDEK